eukprot:14145679-Alexandrium_andersonii.AAC.1
MQAAPRASSTTAQSSLEGAPPRKLRRVGPSAPTATRPRRTVQLWTAAATAASRSSLGWLRSQLKSPAATTAPAHSGISLRHAAKVASASTGR